MKRTDFQDGKKGFIIRAVHNTDATPVNIRIIEVRLSKHFHGKKTLVFDAKSNPYEVEPKDVLYTRETARIRVLGFLSKQHQKFMKGVVE